MATISVPSGLLRKRDKEKDKDKGKGKRRENEQERKRAVEREDDETTVHSRLVPHQRPQKSEICGGFRRSGCDVDLFVFGRSTLRQSLAHAVYQGCCPRSPATFFIFYYAKACSFSVEFATGN
jgi:hypothetical protein